MFVCLFLNGMMLYHIQVYSADEAFVTGTFAGILPVIEVDGRVIGEGVRGPLTEQLQQLYQAMLDEQAAAGRDAA
jgi:branched-chain amino acid aminotransferase